MDNKFKDISENIILSKEYEVMKKYIAHGDISCYCHCYKVALSSYKFAVKHNIKCNLEDLVTGALLHDYYLYDWHDRDNSVSLHGYKHHHLAKVNAVRDFNINKRTQKIIYSHMFPFTIWTLPTTKEAIIVSIFDKITALKEILKIA